MNCTHCGYFTAGAGTHCHDLDKCDKRVAEDRLKQTIEIYESQLYYAVEAGWNAAKNNLDDFVHPDTVFFDLWRGMVDEADEEIKAMETGQRCSTCGEYANDQCSNAFHLKVK